MQNSVQWWNSIKNDPVKFNEWLVKQYRGEVTAAKRIKDMADKYTLRGDLDRTTLYMIAHQEEQHARWVKELLDTRNVDVPADEIEKAEKRYWSHTLPIIKDLQIGAAVAAHAEGMRLKRIRAIVEDEDSPKDVKKVFSKILVEEEWHEKAFTHMTNTIALDATRDNHEAGMKELGLEV